MAEIKTSNGIFEFNEVEFKNGIKKINLDISKKNLLDLKKILDKNDIYFGLIYGTLLGAIREKNFIAHDEDTDIFMLEEDKDKLLNILNIFVDNGFLVGRYTEKLLSVIRNGEYIDIYFFKKKGVLRRECEGYIIDSIFLENTEDYSFLGDSFRIPVRAKELLVKLYGSDWETPKENEPASNYTCYLSIKMFIMKRSLFLYKIIGSIKRKLNV